MPSRISYFNKTVFWSDQRRFWPLTALYALFWVLMLPVSRITIFANDRDLSAWNKDFETLNLAAGSGYWVAFFFGILFAMAAFSYLANPRSTNGLHALPARRETLYVTHCLAGLCAQLAVQLVSVLLTGAVLASNGAFDARILWLMLLSLALPTFFFYSFGVLCMIFTGQILAAPVFYGVLNILVVGVEMLLRGFAGNFLYGWSGSTDPALTVFSPLVKLLENGVRASTSTYTKYPDGTMTMQENAGGAVKLLGLDWLLIYAAVGIVIALLGLLVYRSRHSEATGSTVAIPWARPIFKYGVALCAALALGQLIYHLLFGRFRTSGDYSLAGTLLCMAVAGLIGYYISEMLLKKSFRVFRSGWKGALAVVVVLVALGAVMSFDLTGYEGYVPPIDKVESVRVTWYGQNGASFTYNSREVDTILLVTDAHRSAVADKQRQIADYRATGGGWSDSDAARGRLSGSLTLNYTMKDGRYISREYGNLILRADELDNALSTAGTMSALYNSPGLSLKRSLDGFGSYRAEYDSDLLSLRNMRLTGGCFYGQGYVDSQRDLTAAQARNIYEAILRDVALGHTSSSLLDYTTTSSGVLELYAAYTDTTAAQFEPENRRMKVFTPCITERMTETLDALREIGIDLVF